VLFCQLTGQVEGEGEHSKLAEDYNCDDTEIPDQMYHLKQTPSEVKRRMQRTLKSEEEGCLSC